MGIGNGGKQEGPSGQSLWMMVFGIFGLVGVIVTNIFLPSIETSMGAQPTNYELFVKEGVSALKGVALVMLYCSIVVLLFKTAFGPAWSYFIRQNVATIASGTSEHLSDISNEITAIKDDANGLSEEFKKFMIHSRKPLALSNYRTNADLKKLIKQPSRLLYGTHINNKLSFFTHIQRAYLDSFSKSPHPSELLKTITVENHPDKNDYVKWKEVTSYRIHHVAFEEEDDPVEYMLQLFATSYAPGKSAEEWTTDLKFSVRVNGVEMLAEEKKKCEEENRPWPRIVDEENDEEGFFCMKTPDDPWIVIWYKKTITLTEEWTRVVTTEESINSKVDRIYTLSANQPTCGYTLDVTVPKDTVFQEAPFLTSDIIHDALPECARRSLPKRVKPSVLGNHTHIEIRGWLLPGIIASLNWLDEEEKSKALESVEG